MEDKVPNWKERIGQRIRELRDLEGWSLSDLARRTGDRLQKSRLSNYEQGERMPGPAEAVILGAVFEVAPAHVLCLDDDMPALSKEEADLIRNFRALPENQRQEYSERIADMALIYKKPVAHERLLKTGLGPRKRPRNKPTKEPK